VYWVAGDGSYDNSKGGRISLCTDNFTLDEVNKLIPILLDKFSVRTYP